MTAPESVAAVLALVSNQEAEQVEAEVEPPPARSSVKATALYYALLGEYDFTIGERVILDQLVATQTHLDEIEADWRRDGSPTTAVGSMQQPVTEPRVQEMRQLRGQVASLVKSLNLPADGAGRGKRRPGRPTRAESAAQGKHSQWGTR